MVRALFGAGHDVVILDATSVTEKRRRQWVHPDWTTVVKCFNVGPNICRDRAIASGRPELIEVIDRMAAEWEPIDLSLYTEIESMGELEL